jgi:hypothetical protein
MVTHQYEQKFLDLFAAFLITIKSRDEMIDVEDYCDEALRTIYTHSMQCDQSSRDWQSMVREMMTPKLLNPLI